MTVHLLYEGFALCGLPGIPRNWPDGDSWVGLRALEEGYAPDCLGCLCVAKERKLYGDYVSRCLHQSAAPTENEQMEALGPVLNKALQKLLPKGMKCAVVLYNSEHRLMTLGNAHPQDIHTLLKAALEIVETQLAVQPGAPANDDAAEPHRCRYCRRPVLVADGMCESCTKMTHPQY